MLPTPLPNTFIMQARTPRVFTKNLTPSKTFFDQEKTWMEDTTEYREIDVRHSKLAAALVKGCQQFGIKQGDVVLYLGASHGYTPSFMSDMVGKDGMLFCIDVAPRVVRDLVFVSEARQNMAPILASALHPESYTWRVTQVDVVYQDIAQKDQINIFLNNIALYLKDGGFGMLALKARSINTLRHPKDIYKEVRATLEKTAGIIIVDYRELDPFEKDHAFFVVKKKSA